MTLAHRPARNWDTARTWGSSCWVMCRMGSGSPLTTRTWIKMMNTSGSTSLQRLKSNNEWMASFSLSWVTCIERWRCKFLPMVLQYHKLCFSCSHTSLHFKVCLYIVCVTCTYFSWFLLYNLMIHPSKLRKNGSDTYKLAILLLQHYANEVENKVRSLQVPIFFNQRKNCSVDREMAVMSQVPVRNPGSDIICCHGCEKLCENL